MAENGIFKELSEIVGEENIIENEPLSRHTSFKIGGPARYFLTPKDEEGIVRTVSVCREKNIPFYVIGNGSNLLVSDRGYDGVIIRFTGLKEIKTEGEKIYVQAGASLAAAANEALKNSLAGFEFAAGIPGTAGGALVMNAGAYGGEMSHVTESARVLDKDGNIIMLTNEELDFSYRNSVVSKKGYYALSAVIKLEHTDDMEAVRAKMQEFAVKRREKQPLEYPSAGSTFKRPEGHFAGKLIMDAGLSGYSIGGACISEKHCGFIINKGGATADNVIELINFTKKTVKEKFGVEIEPEIKMLGM